MDGTHITIITPPRDRDMTVLGHTIVGGIEIHPSEARTPCRTPGMRRIGAHQTRSADGRERS